MLRRRYGSDYSIAVTSDVAEASAQLHALRDEGELVALVIAPYHLGHGGGIPFLAGVRELHPTARRVLMLDVGDVGAADDLSRALTLAQIDFYFGQPWASPEEEVYPVLAEALRLWAREHQPRYEKAVIIDTANGSARRGAARLARTQHGGDDAARGRRRPRASPARLARPCGRPSSGGGAVRRARARRAHRVRAGRGARGEHPSESASATTWRSSAPGRPGSRQPYTPGRKV